MATGTLESLDPATAALTRRAVAALGALLSYPRRERFSADLARAGGRLVEAGESEAAEALQAFAAAAGRRSFEELEELYTRTFDLSPRCAPFLSVHLFGQESFRRARLMTGLEAAYRRVGFDRGTELPDHLAVVLQAAVAFPEEEWRELVEMALARALARMLGALEGDDPYRHLLRAVRLALGVADLPEEAPPRRSTGSPPQLPDPLPTLEGGRGSLPPCHVLRDSRNRRPGGER